MGRTNSKRWLALYGYARRDAKGKQCHENGKIGRNETRPLSVNGKATARL